MSPEEIRRVAEAIAQKLTNGGQTFGVSPYVVAHAAPHASDDGIFSTIDDAVKAARAAFMTLSSIGLEQRKLIIESMRREMRKEAENIARMAYEETGYGRAEDKTQKNLLVTNKT